MTLHLWGLLRATCHWSQTLDPLVFVPEEGRVGEIFKRPQCLAHFTDGLTRACAGSQVVKEEPGPDQVLVAPVLWPISSTLISWGKERTQYWP